MYNKCFRANYVVIRSSTVKTIELRQGTQALSLIRQLGIRSRKGLWQVAQSVANPIASGSCQVNAGRIITKFD